MNKISSGFIVRGQNGKFLLGRVRWGGKEAWSFFKGTQEKDETLLETAIRELREESGIDINSDERLNRNISWNPIYSYTIKKSKDVFLFLLNDVTGALNNFNFKCESFWEDSKGNLHPEIIEYKWYELSEIYNVLFKSQQNVVDILNLMFGGK